MSPIDMTNALKTLPKILYRGDQAARVSRSTGQSLMVDRYQTLGLFTNLLCGGNPLAIARDGIRTTVSQHVNGWSDSHYLSFSEDLRVAELFARGLTSKQLVPSCKKQWDSVIFSFDTSQMTWALRGIGIFVGAKRQPLPPYSNGVTQVALIDCVTLLSSLVGAGQPQYMPELSWARSDKEWLLIPLDPMPPGPNSHIGYSAQLQPNLVLGQHFDLV